MYVLKCSVSIVYIIPSPFLVYFMLMIDKSYTAIFKDNGCVWSISLLSPAITVSQMNIISEISYLSVHVYI